MAGEKIGNIVEAKEARDFVATVKLDKDYLYRISVSKTGEKRISLHNFSTDPTHVFNDNNPVFEGILSNLKELNVPIGDNTYMLKFLIFDESKLADPNATDVLADKYSDNTRIGISSEVFVFPNSKREADAVVPIANKSIEPNISPVLNNGAALEVIAQTDQKPAADGNNLIEGGIIDEDKIVGGSMLKLFNKEPTYQELTKLSRLTTEKGLQCCFIFGDKTCGGCVELKNTIAKSDIPDDVVVFDIPGKNIDEKDPNYIRLFGIDHTDPDKFYTLPRIVTLNNGSLKDYTDGFTDEYTDNNYVQRFLNSLQKSDIAA